MRKVNFSLLVLDVFLILPLVWHILGSAFVLALFSTLIGAFFGAWWGFRFALRKDRITAQQEKEERKKKLMMSIKSTLARNLTRVAGISKVAEHGITFSDIDTSVLDSTVLLRYELIDDPKLAVGLESLRSMLWDIHRMLDRVRDIDMRRIESSENKTLSSMRIDHVNTLKKQAEDVVNKISSIIMELDLEDPADIRSQMNKIRREGNMN